MPYVQPGARVLVTGANGYIAMWIVKDLLDRGYLVRGVVRYVEKANWLKDYFGSYGDGFEAVVVKDMISPGAFDEALKDVDAIEHTASPATFSAVEPDDYINPAVQGSLGILNSALKFGNKLKRIVYTSSTATINNVLAATPPNTIFDETQWADDVVQIVQEKGRDALPIYKYCASKIFAEKAVWDFYTQHKNELQWDLVVLNPSFVAGPSLQAVKTPADLSQSMQAIYYSLTQEKADAELKITFNLVDVRDTAKAHVEALNKEAAAGERIIITDGALTLQGIRNLLHALRPDLYATGVLSRGNPDLDSSISFSYNAEKGKKVLGLDYMGVKNMGKDLLAYFEAKGWLKQAAD